MSNPVIISNATLYLGDCREILPSPPKRKPAKAVQLGAAEQESFFLPSALAATPKRNGL